MRIIDLQISAFKEKNRISKDFSINAQYERKINFYGAIIFMISLFFLIRFFGLYGFGLSVILFNFGLFRFLPKRFIKKTDHLIPSRTIGKLNHKLPVYVRNMRLAKKK